MSRRFLPIFPIGAFLATAIVLIAALQSSVSAGSARVSANPVWGPDIRVSPPSGKTTDLNRNLSIAVDPTNPNNAMASYVNFTSVGDRSFFSDSTDGGRTWTSARLPLLGTDQMIPVHTGGVAYDAAGTAYYLTVAVTSTRSGVFVLTGTNGLLNQEVTIITSDYSEFRGQPQLAVDPRSQGQFASNIYSFWLFSNNIGGSFQGIWLRYSQDKGSTWSNDVKVSDPGNEISFGPSTAIGSNGTVYVASQQLAAYSIDIEPKLFLDRSTSGGATWGPDRLITGAPITKIGIPDWKGRELTLAGSEACSLIRIFHFPHIAVAPDNPNTVYVVWNDGRWDQEFTQCTGTGRHSDIAFSRTTDGGLTWSAPIRINDDQMGNGVDQWNPGIGVSAEGVIGVTWYDRRYDPSHPYWYDSAYSQSTDGGVTWSPNVRISDASSDPDSLADVKGIDDVGYRQDLAFGPDYVLPAWVNAEQSANHGDFYTDRGMLLTDPSATPTRTATPTSSPTVVVASSTPTPCAIAFSDVQSDDTFYAFIRCLACRGIISGYSDGTFRPGNEITRSQIAKMVSNAAGLNNDPGGQIYEDVDAAHPFFTWINRLSRLGYMSGYPCDTVPEEPCNPPDNRPYFRPFANATRGQLAKIVSNAAGIGGTPTGLFFADVPEEHTFYVWIMRLTQLGVMGGYPCGTIPEEPCDEESRPYFRPFNNVTRGQASKIVANTFFPGCQTPQR